MPPTPPDDDDDESRARGNIAVLIAVAILLAIGWFVMQRYEANRKMETCLIEKRSDCDSVFVPPR